MELHVLGVGVLTWLTFLPIVGMIAILTLPRENRAAVKWTAAIVTLLQLVLAVLIFLKFDKGLPGINSADSMQFVERMKWIDIKSTSWFGKIQIEYFMGIDGLSAPMVLLTALISFIAVFASWNIEKALKGYMAMLLLLDTGMMGVFVALDFFLFYVFWEVMLLPMYFLIGIWGGPRREYAAIKFFLYTLLGSILMLLAILALYFTVAPYTFDMRILMSQAGTYSTQVLPIWPFHLWGWGFQHVI